MCLHQSSSRPWCCWRCLWTASQWSPRAHLRSDLSVSTQSRQCLLLLCPRHIVYTTSTWLSLGQCPKIWQGRASECSYAASWAFQCCSLWDTWRAPLSFQIPLPYSVKGKSTQSANQTVSPCTLSCLISFSIQCAWRSFLLHKSLSKIPL